MSKENPGTLDVRDLAASRDLRARHWPEGDAQIAMADAILFWGMVRTMREAIQNRPSAGHNALLGTSRHREIIAEAAKELQSRNPDATTVDAARRKSERGFDGGIDGLTRELKNCVFLIADCCLLGRSAFQVGEAERAATYVSDAQFWLGRLRGIWDAYLSTLEEPNDVGVAAANLADARHAQAKADRMAIAEIVRTMNPKLSASKMAEELLGSFNYSYKKLAEWASAAKKDMQAEAASPRKERP